MKILKIENGTGFFRFEEASGWQPIDTIDKNGLVKILDLFLAQDVELDSPDDLTISNQAHSIIYRSVYQKLYSLIDDKKRFKDESERMYLEEIKKYSNS
ncbi:hypothetical protein GFL78_09790 [Rhizobium leguminosarum bv. viciae]|nr:hypothetical protein [Rhizobium leguminosarum bv. viciae]